MAWVVVVNADGRAHSIGSVAPGPLPETLSAVEITEQEWQEIRTGLAVWDPATLAVVPNPQVPIEATRRATTAALVDKARQALTTNATFLAIASPTNAQTLAQVRALTRECSALIRLQGQTIEALGDLLQSDAGT